MNQWIVSLNDGQRISMKDLLDEQKTNPWRKLLDFVRNTKNIDGTPKAITHVELVINGIHYNSPSKSKASSFYSGVDPKMFWIFYKDISGFMGGGNQNKFMCFSYRTGEYRNFLWVQESNNFVYTQCLNVVNPRNKIEENFKAIEEDIVESYKGIEDGGASCT